ncbi:hypothetical protein [Mycetocola miduiensis]|uniref:hypothetical protein n=1 Tax=Mycetocola miduiensis TaxID=995034 RepID=UPI0015A6E01C|nr:hypothetical protein [Mycetocola miduiensis]
MDITWLFVVLVLVVIFARISVAGALRRIVDATEKSASDLAILAAVPDKSHLRL